MSDTGDFVIRMEGVSVRRGDTTLLDAVDWAVELDERWVVLGPNGAGKTTLLRLAAAEHPPDRGASSTSSASGSAGWTCSSCAPGSGCRRRRWGCACRPTRSSATS